MFSFLPIGPLLGTRYDVLEKIRAVKTPLLELHGDRDEVVPFDQGKLVSLCGTATEEIYHARWRGPQRYLSGRQRPVF